MARTSVTGPARAGLAAFPGSKTEKSARMRKSWFNSISVLIFPGGLDRLPGNQKQKA